MIKSLVHSVEAFFAPVFALLGDLPPSTLNRLFTPF